MLKENLMKDRRNFEVNACGNFSAKSSLALLNQRNANLEAHARHMNYSTISLWKHDFIDVTMTEYAPNVFFEKALNPFKWIPTKCGSID